MKAEPCEACEERPRLSGLPWCKRCARRHSNAVEASPWVALSPAIILPRCAGGVDYGCERVLLAVSGDCYVEWRKGNMHWAGVGGREYGGTELVLSNARLTNGLDATSLREGGRFSQSLWNKHSRAIAKHLNVSESELPKPSLDTTMVLASEVEKWRPAAEEVAREKEAREHRVAERRAWEAAQAYRREHVGLVKVLTVAVKCPKCERACFTKGVTDKEQCSCGFEVLYPKSEILRLKAR